MNTAHTRGRSFKSDSQRKAMFAQLAERHQGLVRREVNSAVRRSGPMYSDARSDLMQAGNIGLLQYAKRYNPKRSASFSTGASQAIRTKVQREIQRSKLVRVSEKKLGAEARKGALPTTVDLKEANARSTMGGIDQAEHRADIARLMKRLSPRDSAIIRMRYLEDRTASQVAKKLRISSTQVMKVEKRSLANLRN